MERMVDAEKTGSAFVFFAVLAIIASIFSLGLVYMSASTLLNKISGYVSSGEANLTVETKAEVNFTTNVITWGNGRVNQGGSAASLTTSNYTGIFNVTGGNWTLDTDPKAAGFQGTGGMKIENIGNVNVSLNLSAGKNAATFIGGTSPAYEWNLTAMEAGSCLNGTQQNISFTMDRLLTVTSAGASNIWCDVFPYEATKDTVRIDFNLTIPENSLTGALGDVITATVTSL